VRCEIFFERFGGALRVVGIPLLDEFADRPRLVFKQRDERVPAVHAGGGPNEAIGIE
jgi:hypothetical protein